MTNINNLKFTNMKKFFLLSLSLVLGFSAFAQVRASKAAKDFSVTAQKPSAERIIDAPAAEGIQYQMPQSVMSSRATYEYFDEFESIVTNYDLQSNSALGNRIAVWPDGTAAFTATWDHSGNNQYPDRGTGYNYYDGSEMGEMPEVRQEPVKSGWPSLAACGNGELLASHATGVNLYYRPTKGEGTWTLVKNWGASYGSPTWPRVVVSGPNNEYVHLVMCKQNNIGTSANPIYENHIYYVRMTRNGDTFEETIEFADFPGLDNSADGDYRNQLSADDYVMAANGDNVAVMFSSYTTEVFYMISHDNGATWERQIIAPYPILGTDGNPVHAIDFEDYPEGMTDSINTSDNSHSIAIDNDGVVHAAFGLFHWKVADSDSYTYWPVYGFGMVYWNSNYVNPQGGHEIPIFGTFDGDAAHTEWQANGVGYTLMPERIAELSEADGNEGNLRIFALIDEDGDGYYGGYENSTGATWHYRTFGCASMPGVSVDENGDLIIVYNVWSEVRVCQTTSFSYRSAYVTCKLDGEWYDDAINLGEDFIHEYDEVYATTASPKAYNGEFWVMYNADENQGLFLDINDNYPDSNGGVMTENVMWAVKVTPRLGINDNDAVNPMTAVRAYPNPATDVLTLEINASMASDMNVSFYNITGQKVMSKMISVNTGINSASINVNELESGVYFCSVTANGFNKAVKVIVK